MLKKPQDALARELKSIAAWVARGWHDRALESAVTLWEARPRPRLARLLRSLRPGAGIEGGIRFGDSMQRAEFLARLDAVIERAERSSSIDDDFDARQAALLEGIEASLRPQSGAEEELWAAVYADLSRDDTRLVLADALTQRGDPRGELIVLQIESARTGKVTARERELLKTFAHAWLGPLQWLVAYPVYRRGFLVAAKHVGSGYDFSAPEWSTLETLEWQYHSWQRALLDPGLRRLKKTYTLSGHDLRSAADKGLRLAAQHLGIGRPIEPFLEPSIVGEVLPELKRVDLFWGYEKEAVGPLFAAGYDVGLNAGLDELARCASILNRDHSGRSITLGLRASWTHVDDDWPAWSVTLRARQSAKGVDVTALLHQRELGPTEQAELIAALRAAPVDRVRVGLANRRKMGDLSALVSALAAMGVAFERMDSAPR